MAEEKNDTKGCCKKSKGCGGISSAVYGLGFIGSIIYFYQHATDFGMFVMGFLKSLVWPAILVYKALEAFKM
ncbi:MAG: hypothetical protein M1450_05385 [Patescibacteria group bacterium]|nr:hypothetical protein [Patescibacteria group bacterium]